MLTFLKRFKDSVIGKKYISEKDYFGILRWPYVTFIGLWGHTSFYNKIASYVSIHINECAKKIIIKLKDGNISFVNKRVFFIK